MEPLKQKGSKSSLTTHDRVLKETSLLAHELAKRLKCSKIELYSWLIKWAMENEGTIMAQGELIITKKEVE